MSNTPSKLLQTGRFFTSKTCLFTVLVASLVACGGGGDSSATAGTAANTTTSSANVSGTGLQKISSIYSDQVGVTYDLKIYLPVGYQANQAYPIIYALDGGPNFDTMTSILDQTRRQTILIGIGRPERRTEDYNLPGAYAYYKFLTLELIPFIERQYNGVAAQRTLEGHSFGGLFVGIALFLDQQGKQFFSNFIAQEGTFNIDPYTTNTIAQLEQKTFEVSQGKMPVKILLSGATQFYFKTNQDFYLQLLSRHYEGITLQLKEYNQTHGGMFSDSFADSVNQLFP